MAKKIIKQGALTINILSGRSAEEASRRQEELTARSLEAARRDPYLRMLWASAGVMVAPASDE